MSLYDLALQRQQSRRIAVVARRGNVLELRDPWAISESNMVALRVPYELRPDTASRLPIQVSNVLDALMLLQREQSRTFATVMEQGVRDGWAKRGPAGSYGVVLPLLRMNEVQRTSRRTFVYWHDGSPHRVSALEIAETFRDVGGVPRLVHWAKEHPNEFSELCRLTFRSAHESAS